MFEVTRLFERVPYPWRLENSLKIRKGALNASYFAVAYKNYEIEAQVVGIY